MLSLADRIWRFPIATPIVHQACFCIKSTCYPWRYAASLASIARLNIFFELLKLPERPHSLIALLNLGLSASCLLDCRRTDSLRRRCRTPRPCQRALLCPVWIQFLPHCRHRVIISPLLAVVIHAPNAGRRGRSPILRLMQLPLNNRLNH